MGSSAKVSVGHRASFVHALVALFFIRYLSLAARFLSLPVPRQPLVFELSIAIVGLGWVSHNP